MTATKLWAGGSRPGGAYSPAILATGQFLFVSGQGPVRDGAVVGTTIADQTRATLENIAAILAAAGAVPADVVRCGVYLADLDDFGAMDAEYANFFPEPRPARTTIGAALKGIKVEIDCIAVLAAGDDVRAGS